jgi:hypothetical protein
VGHVGRVGERGTVHNRLQCAAAQASAINRAQYLSAIGVGLLHDEIFQGAMPVLAGVDAASTGFEPRRE